MTTEEKRLLIFKRICAGQSQVDFASSSGINASYISQLMGGHKLIGERAAQNLEIRLGLIPGILVHPHPDSALDSTPVSTLYLPEEEDAVDDDGAAQEVFKKRLSILKALIGDVSRVEFCNAYKLNPAYLNHLMNGARKIGAKSARSLEESLGLKPGVLEHPNEVELDTLEKIQNLYLIPKPQISAKGRLFLANMESILNLSAITDDHIELLGSMAYQLALPRLDDTHDRRGENVHSVGDGANTHYRVTLSSDMHPHRIVSVLAADRDSAKQLAASENPGWEVVQARVSKKPVPQEPQS